MYFFVTCACIIAFYSQGGGRPGLWIWLFCGEQSGGPEDWRWSIEVLLCVASGDLSSRSRPKFGHPKCKKKKCRPWTLLLRCIGFIGLLLLPRNYLFLCSEVLTFLYDGSWIETLSFWTWIIAPLNFSFKKEWRLRRSPCRFSFSSATDLAKNAKLNFHPLLTAVLLSVQRGVAANVL